MLYLQSEVLLSPYATGICVTESGFLFLAESASWDDTCSDSDTLRSSHSTTAPERCSSARPRWGSPGAPWNSWRPHRMTSSGAAVWMARASTTWACCSWLCERSSCGPSSARRPVWPRPLRMAPSAACTSPQQSSGSSDNGSSWTVYNDIPGNTLWAVLMWGKMGKGQHLLALVGERTQYTADAPVR